MLSLDGNHITVCRLQSTNGPGYVAVEEAIQQSLGQKTPQLHLFSYRSVSGEVKNSEELLAFQGIPPSKMEEDVQDAFTSSELPLRTADSVD
jgi:hypothetical protein